MRKNKNNILFKKMKYLKQHLIFILNKNMVNKSNAILKIKIY